MSAPPKSFDIRECDLADVPKAGGSTVHIRAGFRGTERIVPPAGEQYAFTRDLYERDVEIYVSPTGRSVRVFVDGEEVRR